MSTNPPADPPNPDGGDPQNTNDPVQSELARARREASESRAALKTAQQRVQELEGSSKSEVQKAHERAAVAEGELEQLRLRQLKLEIGVERGLPMLLINALGGSSREEIEEAAEAAKKQLDEWRGSTRRPAADGKTAGVKDGGAAPGGKGPDPNSWLRDKIKTGGG